ncbi:TIGR02302 family protein [Pelagibius sp. 7325]|uniref:TIGR02302 family protein n=1 Tax=Pelagibius sp. 7325 TaxID=3131994 RepID=UPI0030EC2932
MSETERTRPSSPPQPSGATAPGGRPGPDHIRRAETRFGFLLALARGAVAWETIWPALWPLFAVLGLFLAVALSGLLPALSGWLHSLALAAFAVALLAALVHAARRISLPDELAGKRRLERDSGLDHRPLTALDDRMATGTGDAQARALWRAHQRRVIARLKGLRVGLPRPGMAAFDPWALRGLVVLLVLVGFAASDGNVGGRLAAAVAPSFNRIPQLPPSLDAWINPPAYTGMAPVYLEAVAPGPNGGNAGGELPSSETAAPAAAERLRVPAGSVLLAQVQGGDGEPSLQVGSANLPFENFAHEAYRLEHSLTEGDSLAIVQNGETLAAWPLELVPDNPPEIVFQEAPARTERSALRLTYAAKDDYGLAEVKAVVRRLDQPEAEPLELDLVLPGATPETSEATSYHDLTPHPWAGLAVEIQLVAKDQPGQEGRSEALRTVIPERIFNHPVARALVELRKQLTLNPDRRLPVVQTLSAIYEHPEHFYHDIVVALTIRSAERRLIHDSSDEAIGQVQELLWDAALRIEEGELAVAERELREAQEALMEALARDAPDEEIERLIEELQQAMNEFLDQMIEQMREQMAQESMPMENQELPPNSQMLNRQDLMEMLEKARELAKAGAKDAARELLSQLREMLENLKANPYAQQMNQDMQNASRMMREMEDMMREQQELLDRSFERSQQQGQQGEGQQQQQGDNQGDAQRQEQLRRQLGELMRQLGDALGEIPRPLGRAEREMRDARDALGNEQPGQAVPSQTRSLDQLQQGMQSAMEQFMEMFGPGEGEGGEVGSRGRDNQRDPLGRESQEGPNGQMSDNTDGVQIPDQMELRRTREIVDELRRRRGERERPPLELDYLDRLLDQF